MLVERARRRRRPAGGTRPGGAAGPHPRQRRRGRHVPRRARGRDRRPVERAAAHLRRQRAGAAAGTHAASHAEEPLRDERRRAARVRAGDRRARFQLHWLAVEAGLAEHDSATGTPAPQLAERLLRDDPTVDQGALDAALAGLGERVLIPVHPWELEHLREHDDVVAALLADGAIADLGPLGGPVMATTSVRTVQRPDWPWQLKFSLHVRVTNSQRVTLPKELRRAVEAARLLQTPVGERAAAIAPGLVMLQDPAYLAVRHGGRLIDGLSVLLRENRWHGDGDGERGGEGSGRRQRADDALPGPSLRRAQPARRDRRRDRRARGPRARPTSRATGSAATPTSCSSRSLRLFLDLGLCMEPHAQNVLLELDAGWPARAVYRDSQGYFHREAAHADMTAILPGHRRGERVDLPRGARRRAARLLPVRQQRARRDQCARRRGLRRRGVLLGDLRALLERERARAAGRGLPGDAPGPPARRRPAGPARPTCAPACTTWTS